MSDQAIPGAEGVTETRKSQKSLTFWFINLVTHRWIALTAMLWLMVLGFTGVIVDHPEWRWSHQWEMTDRFASDHILIDEVHGTIVRKFQMNPSNTDQILGGGRRGLWRTANSGQEWIAVDYAGTDETPMLLSLQPSKDQPWQKIWLGTDDGLWRVSGLDGEATFVGLAGKTITALDYGERPGELFGIIGDSTLFRVDTNTPDTITYYDTSDVNVPGMPEDISLARWLVELHLGQSLMGGGLALFINDFAGVVIIILALTGFCYWLFPRLWRDPERKKKWSKETRRSTLQWLFRFHSPILGLVAIIPIIYLSVSGIFLDHARALIPSAMATGVSTNILGGPYKLESLNGNMSGLHVDPNDVKTITILTRLGMVKTEDGGKTWAYDENTPFAVNRRHHNPGFIHVGNLILSGNHGGPVFIRDDVAQEWTILPGMRLMAQDAAKLDDGWVLKGSGGFFSWSPETNTLEKLDIPNPPLSGMPFFNFMLDLHTGLMIHSTFVWVNDIAAGIAILLCITGFVAWWRKKWI